MFCVAWTWVSLVQKRVRIRGVSIQFEGDFGGWFDWYILVFDPCPCIPCITCIKGMLPHLVQSIWSMVRLLLLLVSFCLLNCIYMITHEIMKTVT